MSKVAPDTKTGYIDMVDLTLIATCIDTFIDGYTLGQLLAASEHEKEFKTAMSIIEDIDFKSDASSTEIALINQALVYFSMVNDEDRLYLQCYAYYMKSILYAYILEFDKANYYFDKITNLETTFTTVNRREIQNIQNAIPDLKQATDDMQEELAKQQNDMQKELAKQQKKDCSNRKLKTMITFGLIIGVLILVANIILVIHSIG